jgi:hypothetical protein
LRRDKKRVVIVERGINRERNNGDTVRLMSGGIIGIRAGRILGKDK